MDITVFWFRRDLRLVDNIALARALDSGYPVLPLFIFDTTILEPLAKDDGRVTFIHKTLIDIQGQLQQWGSDLRVYHGEVPEVWQQVCKEFSVKEVYCNRDYEPYAQDRDRYVYEMLREQGIPLKGYKDQVIFEKNDVLKKDGMPYTVFTPYKKKWLLQYDRTLAEAVHITPEGFLQIPPETVPSLEWIGFQKSSQQVLPPQWDAIKEYEQYRDFPAQDHITYLSPHLRFGTVGVRDVLRRLQSRDSVFLSELIWREFFMQILYHFPHVETEVFREKYRNIPWRNSEEEFEKWCRGETGYPLVDAGIRQLNQTGYMHNRVRMIVAGFLCKHLLIDWRWGERYFASKLLDFELAANNGNWQWSAGTGCDAAPYFRVFNPETQIKKFDPQLRYIRRWIPDYDPATYIPQMVEHSFARQRAIATYKEALEA
jgi:deoxyribodipyrimidine photo-lyase